MSFWKRGHSERLKDSDISSPEGPVENAYGWPDPPEEVERVLNKQFPSLGDSRKKYWAELTEPEINAVHSAFGYLQAAMETQIAMMPPDHPIARVNAKWWAHYGPTLKTLSERLQMFDDGDAPLPPTAKKPSDQTGEAEVGE